jgi:hypothetical protein
MIFNQLQTYVMKQPDWGLFNGTVGTVKEIVFNKDENPLDGTLPQYIIVDFPDYCGSPWIENKQTWVPIPQIELSCSNFCCLICFIQGNRVKSSIFFIGDELTKERVKNLTKTKSGEICHTIKRRSRWLNWI